MIETFPPFANFIVNKENLQRDVQREIQKLDHSPKEEGKTKRGKKKVATSLSRINAFFFFSPSLPPPRRISRCWRIIPRVGHAIAKVLGLAMVVATPVGLAGEEMAVRRGGLHNTQRASSWQGVDFARRYVSYALLLPSIALISRSSPRFNPLDLPLKEIPTDRVSSLLLSLSLSSSIIARHD